MLKQVKKKGTLKTTHVICGINITDATFNYEIIFLELFNDHTKLNKHYV